MKKGFTLVELLAVIVILAVILVIAVPQINNVIKQTKTNSLASTAKIIAAKAEEKAVENEILENNEALTCANLVKLDDNYGSCTVSMVNGKGTVTINGAGKFAGITCTGTKDNMSCTDGSSNTPEYIYSFGEPYYEDVYEVKPGKSAECKNWIIYYYNGYEPEDIIDEDDDTLATNICNNSDDIGFDFDGDGYNDSMSDWFKTMIDNRTFSYEDIAEFVTKNEALMVKAWWNNARELVTEDYTNIKYPGTNTQALVFMRWNANETEFSSASPKSVCIIYEGNLHCFEATSSEFEINKTKLQTLFGSSNCSALSEYFNCWSYRDGSVYAGCIIDQNGYVGCQAPNYSCGSNHMNLCGQGGLD